MPSQTGKGLLATKFGDRFKKVHEQKKTEAPVTDSGGGLPAGIEGGIATLVQCKIDTYKEGNNKGQLYFRAAGVVVSPVEHDGIKIEGLQTSIMEPLCDTPQSQGKRKKFEEHYEWVQNQLKLLAGAEAIAGLSPDEVESFMKGLEDASPSFRFRTWKGKATSQFPDPRVNHVWQGATDAPSTHLGNGQAVEDLTNANADGADPDADKETEEAEEGSEELDLDALAKQADAKKPDEDAVAALNAKALEVGIEQETIDNAASWGAVVSMIRATNTETEEGGDGEGADAPLSRTWGKPTSTS